MSIEVLNFKNGGTITYSLVLLNGVVNCLNGEKNASVVFIKKAENKSIIGIWPLNNDAFKAFLELEEGKNEFLLSLSREDTNSNTQFSLTYLVPKNQVHFIRPVYIVCHDDDGRFQVKLII